MAHSGFISDPEYTRRSQDENITGKWVFEDEISFEKVVRGTAIATYYADLAEYYEHSSIESLPIGTLVKFGGEKEITKTSSNGRSFFGIISSKPGIVLNQQENENYLPVALCGKVPCRIKGKIKKFDNYEPIAQTKVLTDVHNKNQADIIEAFKFKNNGNLKDDMTVLLLNTILGGNSSSRLFNDLREQQKLAYSVRSRVNYYKNTGVLMLRIGTTTENKTTNEQSYDNVQKSIDGFNKHIQKIKSEKVNEKELENAKLYCKNMVLSANEDVAGKTSSLESGLYDYYGLNKENLILEMIDKITVDDIYNAANNIFNSKPVYSINATQNTLDANKDYFARLETV